MRLFVKKNHGRFDFRAGYKKYYKDLAKVYDDISHTYMRNKAAAKFFFPVVSKREKIQIVDLGIGTGLLWKLLSEMGLKDVKVEGIDLTPNMIHKAKGKNLSFLNTQIIDGEKIPIPDGSFDLAVSTFCLRHFPKIEKPLEEIHRVLKDDGVLFVSDYLIKHFKPVAEVALELFHEELNEYSIFDTSAEVNSFLLNNDYELIPSFYRGGFSLIRYEEKEIPFARTYEEFAYFMSFLFYDIYSQSSKSEIEYLNKRTIEIAKKRLPNLNFKVSIFFCLLSKSYQNKFIEV